jgi:hypothetical protein
MTRGEKLGPDFEIDVDALRDSMLRGGCCNKSLLSRARAEAATNATR